MRRFPILHEDSTVPWDLVAPHRKGAYANHGQTLEGLADRGGLTWPELLAVMTGRKYRDLGIQPKQAQRREG